jgi:antitoxin CcdA
MGGRIKLARKKLGLSQAALAEQLGVTASAVGQWEILYTDPATDKVGPLAEILRVSVDWLLGEQRRPEAVDKLATATGEGQSVEDARRLGEEAHLLGVDLKQVVVEARQRRWIEENRKALNDANAFLEKHGLWSDGKRLF